MTFRSRTLSYASIAAVFALHAGAAANAQPTPEPSTEVEIEVEATAEPAPSEVALSPAETPVAVPRDGSAVEPEDGSAREVAAVDDTLVDDETEDEEDASLWERAGVVVSGYVQAQLAFSQLSRDDFGPDGTALNNDRFIIRRGRIRADRPWDYGNVAFEIDASTTRGPFVGIRRAEVSLFVPNLDDDRRVPYAMVTVGLTEVPFGFELRQGNRDRWFLERSTASLAFQRGEPDVGVRLSGGYGIFRYAFAVMNGSPLDDRPGGEAIDPTKAKDLVGRLGIDTSPGDHFEIAAGASFYSGTGLHHGTPATKPTLVWNDVNEDGEFDIFEVTTVPGAAATPSQTFRRWASNADVQIGIRSPIGWTRLYGEVTLASNYDRSLYAADPVANGVDVREFAWYAGVVQEITAYAVVGFRVDHYDPNSDLVDERRGVVIPRDASIRTYSPLVGVTLRRYGRLVAQYDFVRDHLGRDASGEPADLRNDTFTLRLQGEF